MSNELLTLFPQFLCPYGYTNVRIALVEGMSLFISSMCSPDTAENDRNMGGPDDRVRDHWSNPGQCSAGPDQDV